MLTGIADGLLHNSEPPEIDDFGFHYPYETVVLCVTLLKASNFASWPEPGGILDQDEFLLRDILCYLKLENRIEYEQEDPDDKEGRDDGPRRVTEDIRFG